MSWLLCLAVDLDGLLANANVTFELSLGCPGQFLFEGGLFGGLGRGSGGDLVSRGFLGLLLSLLIFGQFSLQFGVLGR